MKEHRKRVRTWIIPICLTLFVFLIMKTVLLFGYVPSASMEPTIPEGSYILGLRPYSTLEIGDVIVFRYEEKLLVKRIIAIPGDEIIWEELDYMDGVPRPSRDTPEMVVPDDCFFVLGDNGANSYDSRYWTDPFVRQKDIVAKLIWPYIP